MFTDRAHHKKQRVGFRGQTLNFEMFLLGYIKKKTLI